MSRFVEDIRQARTQRTLPERFRPADVRRACPGWADHIRRVLAQVSRRQPRWLHALLRAARGRVVQLDRRRPAQIVQSLTVRSTRPALTMALINMRGQNPRTSAVETTAIITAAVRCRGSRGGAGESEVAQVAAVMPPRVNWHSTAANSAVCYTLASASPSPARPARRCGSQRHARLIDALRTSVSVRSKSARDLTSAWEFLERFVCLLPDPGRRVVAKGFDARFAPGSH